MVQKKRSPGQTAISLSLDAQLLEKIDARASSLGLSRSVYLATLAKKDIAVKGSLEIPETAAPSKRDRSQRGTSASIVTDHPPPYGQHPKTPAATLNDPAPPYGKKQRGSDDPSRH